MSIVITLPKYLIDKWAEALGVEGETLESIIIEENEGFCFKVETTKESLKETPKEAKTVANCKKPVKKQTATNANHTCERVPRGKTEMCGKNAKKFITKDGETHWYCGSEKSGCYKAALGAVQRNTTPKKVVKSSVAKEQTLLDKIMEKKNFVVTKVVVDGKTLYMNTDNRVLFNSETSKAYGRLDDNDKIVPLTAANKRWLTANGIEEEPYEFEEIEEESQEKQDDEEEHLEEENEEEENEEGEEEEAEED